jgi:hypothetical protein
MGGDMAHKRCFKNRYNIEKVFGSICDGCPKHSECYPQEQTVYDEEVAKKHFPFFVRT